jgi:signal transduction histidine kinase
VIFNLLYNAVKFTKGEDNIIAVMAENNQGEEQGQHSDHHHQHVLVSIIDTSIKIDPPILQRRASGTWDLFRLLNNCRSYLEHFLKS